MINKQNLWFLTLFSLILVLSVYYITMPSNMFASNIKSNSDNESLVNKPTTEIADSSSLEVMRVSLEEERQEEMSTLKEQLTNEDIATEEKNTAYEQLKYLNSLQGKEESLEKKIKKNLKVNSFVKIDNTNIEVVAIASEYDKVLANDIMRIIQEEYTDRMYITVKFQKS